MRSPDSQSEDKRSSHVIGPANTSASVEARLLLQRIASVPGGSVLAGQHNAPRDGSHFTEEAVRISGRTPVVWGQDFGFARNGDMDGVEFRQAIVDEAISQHASGSIITLMWHAVPPTEDEPVTFEGSICRGPLPEPEWSELLTDGTPLHRRWCEQVDVIASFLAKLQEARVPVLWRPYHEMNGDWFWWGGRPGPRGSAALYRRLFDRLVHVHGLHNLVWAWNANAPREDAGPFAHYYPGGDVVDVLACDIYRSDYRLSHHDELRGLAGGRPIGIGEMGQVPEPELFGEQPEWAWFMIWRSFLTEENSADRIRSLYASPRVLCK